MSQTTRQAQNLLGANQKNCHQLYSLSTLLDTYDERENLEELFKLVAEIKGSVFQEGGQQSVEKCFYTLHSKSMTIIDIFTHLLLEANQHHNRALDQSKENERYLQKEIHELRNWHCEESQKAQGMREDLIRSNEELGRNVEALEDMLDKMKAEYDLVKNEFEQMSHNFAQEIKEKEALSLELQQAIAYIEQNMPASDQIVEEEQEEYQDGSSSVRSREKVLRSLKASPAGSNSQFKKSGGDRSDNSTSNLLFLNSPFGSERAQQSHKVHKDYEKYMGNKNSNPGILKKSYNPMLSPPSNTEEGQKYYNPTLIVNSNQQNSIDMRDRSSFESIQKPTILTEILNLNSSYQNTAHRLSSYEKYQNVNPYTNERVSVDIAQGEIKTIEHFQDDQDQQHNQNTEIEQLKGNQRNPKSILKRIEESQNLKVIRIQDQNNSIKANVDDVPKGRKRKGSAVIGQFTTGQCDEVIEKLQNISSIGHTDPYWAFFTLSVQCAKINSQDLQKASSVDLSSLWRQIKEIKLPVHQWQAFIVTTLQQAIQNKEAKKETNSQQNESNLYFLDKSVKKFSKFSKKTSRIKQQRLRREKQVI